MNKEAECEERKGMTGKYSANECIVFSLRDFAANGLETTDDRIALWQSADDLAKTILSSFKEHGYVLTKA